MTVLYSIRNWNEHFEVAQSRKLDGPLNWVGLPTKHDGKSFRRIMLMDDGPAIYGYWVLIVQVAAKCPTRGILADVDGPLDAEDLAIKTGGKPELFDKALKVLSTNKIGWIEAKEVVGDSHAPTTPLPTHYSTLPDSTDKTEPVCVTAGKPPVTPSSGAPLAPVPSQIAFPEFPCIPGKRGGATTWLLTEAHLAELASTFTALPDVRAECRRAHGWVKANLDRRKTAGGMADFIFRWLSREQNSAGRQSGKHGGQSEKHESIYPEL